MKNVFAEAVIAFYLYYPRRRKSNRTIFVIFSSFLNNRKMTAVIEVRCSEPAPLALSFLADLSNIWSGPNHFENLRC